ncbi:hypothetical protein J2X20_002464 [Pelomonas saccharophila]|jgi:hypothetical protein|uniref:Uncharacterized protein n=1 Tax=Roseateles saccharophilus TaxID=304 RepID=A0ABU1YLV7_ROSSA|nr:hypothetical protein [Roseateles saccharophilus]MDR7269835.1 hypothetical protein [Roseateles saccharophilus]
MNAPGHAPLHEQPDTHGFGRVTVGFIGRVMHYIAQGPFDAALMAAAKRGTNIAADRIPADRRYVSLMEFRRPLGMDDEGLREFKETVGGFVERQTVPLATILLVAPGDEDAAMVLDMAAVYRRSRPFQVCTDVTAAWDEVNRVLREAGLPEQPLPASIGRG